MRLQPAIEHVTSHPRTVIVPSPSSFMIYAEDVGIFNSASGTLISSISSECCILIGSLPTTIHLSCVRRTPISQLASPKGDLIVEVSMILSPAGFVHLFFIFYPIGFLLAGNSTCMGLLPSLYAKVITCLTLSAPTYLSIPCFVLMKVLRLFFLLAGSAFSCHDTLTIS